ncbi:MAG: thioesterase family protein [Deltaproteobacteria bacterium]|nr:thioesterase family protein [Deltaproteobacteria bacterium]
MSDLHIRAGVAGAILCNSMSHRFDRRTLSEGREVLYRRPLTVRFQDADAAGIIFFARIPEYFHDAYFAWLMEEGGFDLPEMMRTASIMMPLQHQSCDYFRPLSFGERAEAQVVAVHLEGSSFTVGFRMIRGDEVVAVGQQVHVCADRQTLQRQALPEDFATFLRGDTP